MGENKTFNNFKPLFCSYGSQLPMLVYRFNGSVGTIYTVECPAGCLAVNNILARRTRSLFQFNGCFMCFRQGIGTVYGCPPGPFMDESLICKAAIMSGVIDNIKGGIVSFNITRPIPSVSI